ncbi:Flp pilus assembly protein CpaB [Falsigemmobacter intermedius]|uniref:Flp pilus assembly protein CpaB n=1 Tax=Falsigemmobacter intermedius TaxID=1553448 RepID=A0A444MCF0_9RHOB|nr:Flp pilus assembly protein CpaB [Falsigemmobacter intermedius]RWY41693.1 Flp pilus assembly protein CpaB [Falsigemmobacter intermedius]
MRNIFPLVLVLGLALAGFAAWKTAQFINQSQQREQAALKQVVPTVNVFVANKALPFGHILTKNDLRLIAWPANSVPENAFTDYKVLFPEDKPQTRTVVRQMEKFEPILVSKVSAPGEDGGLNTRLSRGMRAFTIQVDAVSGVAGLVRIGDRVDVYWTGNSAGLTDDVSGQFTKIIETGITVIALDQRSEDTGGSKAAVARTITVEATPQQVARLAQAQVTGRLNLALMGVAEDGAPEVVDVDRRSLIGAERPSERAAPEVEKVCTIKTRRGADVVEIPIPCTN